MYKFQRNDLSAPKYVIMDAITHIWRLLALLPKDLWILTNLQVVSRIIDFKDNNEKFNKFINKNFQKKFEFELKNQQQAS